MRYSLLEFLSCPQSYYEFVFKSAQPKEVTMVDTLLLPFDLYIWTFLLICMSLVALLLVWADLIWASDGMHTERVQSL